MPRLLIPVTEKDHRIGTFPALATLVEYGDYQCLTCRMAVPVMKQLLRELNGQLCVVFRHFPLKITHPYAKIAAEAAEAAAMQNKFWEMHELLYTKQFSMKPGLFHELAEELNLDLVQFDQDIASPAIAHKIEAEFDAAIRSGVNGTPCFYINEERYDGDPSYANLKLALQKACH